MECVWILDTNPCSACCRQIKFIVPSLLFSYVKARNSQTHTVVLHPDSANGKKLDPASLSWTVCLVFFPNIIHQPCKENAGDFKMPLSTSVQYKNTF